MPCGGIYPIKGTWVEPHTDNKARCFHCDEPECTLWVEEWDAPIHRKCVPEFLKTPEGFVILDHGHMIELENPPDSGTSN